MSITRQMIEDHDAAKQARMHRPIVDIIALARTDEDIRREWTGEATKQPSNPDSVRASVTPTAQPSITASDVAFGIRVFVYGVIVLFIAANMLAII